MECLNCHKPIAENYCSHCGQKTSIKPRLSMGVMIGDFISALLNTEKGLLRTLIDLLTDPGGMVRSYMNGHRTTYISVGKFTLLMVVAFTLTLTLLESHFSMFENLTKIANFKVTSTPAGEKKEAVTFPLMGAERDKKKTVRTANGKESKQSFFEKSIKLNLPAWGNGKGYSKNATVKELQAYAVKLIPTYHRLFFDYLRILSVFWVPIFAFLTYMFFFRSGLNMAEHLTLNAYLYSQGLFIFVLLSPLFWLFPSHNGATFSLCALSTLSFLLFSLCDFFKRQRVPLLKATGVITLGLTTYTLFLSCSAVILALVIAYENIDQL